MSIKIKSGYSTKELIVNSDNSLAITMPQNNLECGNIIGVLETDPGYYLSARTMRSYNVTNEKRIQLNLEKTVWQDSFPHSVLNNNKYKAYTNNQTIGFTSGCCILNSSNSVTADEFSYVSTFKYFKITNGGQIFFNFFAAFSEVLQQESLIEFGIGIIDPLYPVTDGVFFRASAGTLDAVVVNFDYSTTERNIYTPVPNEFNDYLLAVDNHQVEFWVNDELVSRIVIDKITGSTSLSNSLPIFIRNYNVSTVSSPISLKLKSIDALFGDVKTNKNWNTSVSLNGQSTISNPDGQPSIITGTTSANIINNSAPISIVLNNTNSGYSTLGGQFQTQASASTENDLIVFSYLNPIGTSSIPGKNLVIQNIYIDTFTSGATTTSISTLQWSVGIGGTSTSMLTEDSMTNGTRAFRRIGIGIQSFPTGIDSGSCADRGVEYESCIPLMIEPGSYMNILLKVVNGDATPSLMYRGNVSVNGYFE